MNILLGVTGSVAATRATDLVAAFQNEGHEVRVVTTECGMYFLRTHHLPDGVTLYRDADEWQGGYARGDDILHIELRRWAEVMLIAPLSANTLAKMAHGMCDNLLTSIVRAWDRAKPLMIAPAMNTHMWEHPATAEQCAALARWYGDTLTVIDPISKTLACGDVGMGAMARIETLVSAVGMTRKGDTYAHIG